MAESLRNRPMTATGDGLGTVHSWPFLTAASIGILPGSPLDRAHQIRETLTDFEWRNGPADYTLDVVEDRPGEPFLVLDICTHDSYDRDRMIRIAFKIPVDTRPPLDQLRSLIHWYLCHEADEHIFHRGVRVFDPHSRAPGA